VHDYGEDARVAYIAMEYVEGSSLREYFDRGTRFAERDVASIMSFGKRRCTLAMTRAAS
jgi:serine/threonine protein kinase